MTREIRSRRADLSRDQAQQPPLYARMLGLQHLMPSGLLCFAFLEGTVALGILLALAELVSWWGVLVLPLTVAAMVKLNDVIAGAVARPAAVAVGVPRTTVRQRSASAVRTPSIAVRAPSMEPHPAPAVAFPLPGDLAANAVPFTRPWGARAEELDSTQQRARQTASRRYE
jgi:hypothetical protein